MQRVLFAMISHLCSIFLSLSLSFFFFSTPFSPFLSFFFFFLSFSFFPFFAATCAFLPPLRLSLSFSFPLSFLSLSLSLFFLFPSLFSLFPSSSPFFLMLCFLCLPLLIPPDTLEWLDP
ncbi:hypothetical protein J3F83DRAFT_388969 [Trichoderma novae-zelandiae]